MPEVELILKADNSQYINSVREAQNATENLHKTASEGAKREKGLIEDIEGEIKRLEEARKKAWRVEDIEKYNQKIAEAKKDLQEYTTAGVGANKTMVKSTDELSTAFGGLLKKIGPITLAIAGLTKVLKGTWEAFKDTTAGLKLVISAGEIWRQLTYNIADGNINMAKTFTLSGVISAALYNLRVQERETIKQSAKYQLEYNEAYFESMDRRQTDTERLQDLNKALNAHNKMVEIQVDHAKEQLDVVKLQLANRPKSNKLLDEEAQLTARITILEGQRFSQVRRIESMRTALEKEIRDKMFKDYYDWIEQQNTIKEKTNELINKFIAVEAEMITDPLEKARAQRDIQLKALRDWLNDLLYTLGDLTPEQREMVQKMADAIQLEFLKSISQVSPADKEAVTQSMKNWMDVILPEFSEYMMENKDKLRPFGGTYPKGKATIWDVLGIDISTAKGQEIATGLKDAGSKIVDVMTDITDELVENATRRRELYDTQITQTQNALQIEAELMEQGFANNVTAKEKELAKLKSLRDQALKDEEKARRAAATIDTLLQTANLITASTEIYKAFSKIPIVGIPLAIAMIGTMFASFAASKVKAASLTKLAEGGTGSETGVITGKSHREGGEHFLDHVEVERGERWGVLSRGASEKYGKVFDKMVYSFNRNEIPEIVQSVPVNNINVDNNGSNSRLDKVIAETRRMNAREGLTIVGNKKIITKGNKTRIIG